MVRLTQIILLIKYFLLGQTKTRTLKISRGMTAPSGSWAAPLCGTKMLRKLKKC